MDSAQMLDILGNENRRKILQLLSNRPYYVSEISGRLGVGPKAIINHLSLLENLGLIKSHVDDQRRKYFNIADNMRLEVSLSPHSYNVSMHTIQVDTDHRDLRQYYENIFETKSAHTSKIFLELCHKIEELKSKQEELEHQQQELQAKYTRIMEVCVRAIEEIADDPLESEILHTLIKDEQTAASLSYNLVVHPGLLGGHLFNLAEKKLIEDTTKLNQQYWKICGTGDEKE